MTALRQLMLSGPLQSEWVLCMQSAPAHLFVAARRCRCNATQDSAVAQKSCTATSTHGSSLHSPNRNCWNAALFAAGCHRTRTLSGQIQSRAVSACFPYFEILWPRLVVSHANCHEALQPQLVALRVHMAGKLDTVSGLHAKLAFFPAGVDLHKHGQGVAP